MTIKLSNNKTSEIATSSTQKQQNDTVDNN